MRFYLFLFFSLFSFLSFSQDTFEQQGDAEMASGHYYNAIVNYKKALASEDKLEIRKKLAHCYESALDYENAEEEFKSLYISDSNNLDLTFHLARISKLNGDYRFSKRLFEKVIFTNKTQLSDSLKQRALLEYNGVLMAIDEEEKAVRDFDFVLLPEPLNTKYNDFSPVLFKNDTSLVITSDRIADNHDGEYGNFGGGFSDNHIFSLNGAHWSSSESSNFEKLNSVYHDGTGVFNQEKSKYYFTQCNDKVKTKDKTVSYSCAISQSQKNLTITSTNLERGMLNQHLLQLEIPCFSFLKDQED